MSEPVYFFLHSGGYRTMLERLTALELIQHVYPETAMTLLGDLDITREAGQDHKGIEVRGGRIIADDREWRPAPVTPAEFSTGLSRAEEERLHLLAEEAGEVVQACMKVLRHGWESRWPPETGQTNRQKLTKELGDFCAATDISLKAKDISDTEMEAAMDRKLAEAPQWLHYQETQADLLRRLLGR